MNKLTKEFPNLKDLGYNVLRVLGEGSYGKVFEVGLNDTHLNSELDKSKTYALKEIYDKKGIRSMREIDIMCKLKHPNLNSCLEFKAERISQSIVEPDIDQSNNNLQPNHLYQSTQSDQLTETNESVVYILMEKAKGDLWDILIDRRYDLAYRLKICKDVATGLQALHDANYLHLDLKSVNILLYSDGAKISDFGLALYMRDREKYYPVSLTTINYRSINVLDGDRNYSPADDVWSLGLIFLETLSFGKTIFDNFKKADFTGPKIKKVYTDFLSESNIGKTLDDFLGKSKNLTKVKNLIRGMLKFKKTERISLKSVLEELGGYDSNKLSIYFPIILKPDYNVYMYKGFNFLFNLCLEVNVNTETYFLAADIYNRSLADWNLMDNITDNIRIAKYHAGLSLFIAVKMVEPYNLSAERVSELCDSAFRPEKLLMAECIYVNNISGITYPDNLFTNSFSEKTLEYATDLCGNLFLYRYIDIAEWKNKYSRDRYLDKYQNFKLFTKNTQYYSLIKNYKDTDIDPQYGIEKYIVDLYYKDKIEAQLIRSNNSSRNTSASSSLNLD